MNKNIITITTDFGDQFAAAQVEAVAYGLGFAGRLIQNHSVTPLSIIEGAFEIQTLSKYCPEGTVHVGVVDPGVGSKRKGIIIKTRNFWFVGPDNGLLYLAAKKDGICKVWKLEEKVVNPKALFTFHGRDIFIRAAVYLNGNREPEDFGSKEIKVKDITPLDIQDGQILHTDSYGNVKVFWSKKPRLGTKLTVNNNSFIGCFPVVKTFSDVPENYPLAYLGSSDTLELALNLGNLSEKHNIQKGEILSIIEQS